MISNGPIPSSTSKMIVFPYNTTDYKFESKNYSPSQTIHRVPKDEIDQVLGEVGLAIKGHMDAADRMLEYAFAWTIAVFGSGTAFTYHKGWLQDAGKSIRMSLIELALVAPAFYKAVTYQTEKTQEMKRVTDLIFEEHNKHWKQKGLRWAMPDAFPKWVELLKEYNAQQKENEENNSSQVSEKFNI